jgi:hypothetical protein
MCRAGLGRNFVQFKTTRELIFSDASALIESFFKRFDNLVKFDLACILIILFFFDIIYLILFQIGYDLFKLVFRLLFTQLFVFVEQCWGLQILNCFF